MIEQHFHGPVHQVAGKHIANHGDTDEAYERRRQARRAELEARQSEHMEVRDAAERRVRRHPCRWIPIASFAAVGASGLYELNHLSAATWLWIIQLALLAIGGATLLVYEHIRRDGRAVWQHHNEAVAEINKALHVL